MAARETPCGRCGAAAALDSACVQLLRRTQLVEACWFCRVLLNDVSVVSRAGVLIAFCLMASVGRNLNIVAGCGKRRQLKEGGKTFPDKFSK